MNLILAQMFLSESKNCVKLKLWIKFKKLIVVLIWYLKIGITDNWLSLIKFEKLKQKML